MEIPLDVNVICSDGVGGRAVGAVLNPLNQALTHIIVKLQDAAETEVLVPEALVSESTPLHIKVACTQSALAQLEPFIEMHFISPTTANYPHLPTDCAPESTWLWPYTLADEEQFGHYESVEQIPHDELAVHRGNEVMAMDGPAGIVEAFIVAPETQHLTHLLLREETLWGENDVTVPVTAVTHIENDIVHLALDKASIKGG